MYILVIQTVNDQQTILFVWKITNVIQNAALCVAVRIVLRCVQVSFGIAGIVQLPGGDRRTGQTALKNVRPQCIAEQRQVTAIAESVYGHSIQIDVVRTGRQPGEHLHLIVNLDLAKSPMQMRFERLTAIH